MNISPNAAKPLTIDDCAKLRLAAARHIAVGNAKTRKHALDTIVMLGRLIDAKLHRPDAASV